MKPENRRIKHSVFLGPTVQVLVSGTKNPDADNLSEETETVHALIDTGCTESCIDTELAKALNLIPVNKRPLSGTGGKLEHLVYLARLTVPELGYSHYGQFTGVSLKAGDQFHSVLLGRDFLRHVIIIYDGIREQVTLASPAKT